MLRDVKNLISDRTNVTDAEQQILFDRYASGWNYDEKLGQPGKFPFTRGIYPKMYSGRPWTIRQYAGFGTGKETNKHFKYLLKQGQSGLSVAFDLPTQLGYDSDDPLSTGEVGKVGVAIDSINDMEILFDSIDLANISVSMTINSPAAVILAMFVALASRRGIPLSALRGTIQNDILKEFIARGTFIFPPKPSLRITTDIIEFCSKQMPNFNPISISGYHIREAGSSAGQEIGYTLSNALTYVHEVLSRGLNIDDFVLRFSFFFSAHNNFFEEIAKLRAARRLWANLMRSHFGTQEDKSLMLKFHTQTAGCTLLAEEPFNNVIRVTLQALAAVLGGTQSLHTNSYDEALALPTKESVLLALRTQQIIAHEMGITNVVDPLGGSYYVENLTDSIEKEALSIIKKVEDLGGVISCIENGYIQKDILDSAYSYELEIEEKKRLVIGRNIYNSEKAKKGRNLFRQNERIETTQKEKIRKLKNTRDNGKVKSILAEVSQCSRSEQNLMPVLIEAVTHYCTIGEICSVLRTHWGEYKEKVAL